MDAAGAPLSFDGCHVLVQSALVAFARVLAAKWLVGRGASLDEADGARVAEWDAALPPRAIVVTASSAGVAERRVGCG